MSNQSTAEYLSAHEFFSEFSDDVTEIPVRMFEHARDQKRADPVSTGRKRGQVLCGPQWAHLHTNAGDNGPDPGDPDSG